MKISFGKSQWTGFLCFFVMYLFAYSYTTYDGLFLFVLYTVLSAVFSLASVLVMSAVMGQDKSPWMIGAVSLVLMLIADLGFRFNVIFPFVLLFVGGVSAESLFRAAERTDDKAPGRGEILVTGAIGVGLYLLLTLPYGIFS